MRNSNMTVNGGDIGAPGGAKLEGRGENLSWANRWYAYLQGQGFDPKRGKTLSRRLNVESLDIHFGRIQAEVAEAQLAACQVEIEVLQLSDTEWSAVLDALAGEALFAAQLLAGGNESDSILEVLDSVFEDADATLLSSSSEAGDLRSHCSACEFQTTPCRHALVVLYLFGQTIAENPWALLLLRGRDRQQVLTELRHRRSTDVEEGWEDEDGKSGAASETPIAGYSVLQTPIEAAAGNEEEPALEEQIDSFWGGRQLGPGGTRQDLQALHYNISPPLIRLALLRRLGPPPFQKDSPDIHDMLARIYLDVSAKALDLAFAPEPEGDDTGNNESDFQE